MAIPNNITSANAVYMLSAQGVFTAPQQLQGFETDDAFDTETVTLAEVSMGVDGVMVTGSVPFITHQTIMLQASSPSMVVFETIIEVSKTRNLVALAATILIPSISRKYDLTNGALVEAHQIAPVKKVLRGRSFKIAWGSVTPAPMS